MKQNKRRVCMCAKMKMYLTMMWMVFWDKNLLYHNANWDRKYWI